MSWEMRRLLARRAMPDHVRAPLHRRRGTYEVIKDDELRWAVQDAKE